MKGMLLRSVSGVVYVAVILLGILIDATCFKVFMSLFAVLALVEFSKLCNKGRERVITLAVDLIGGFIAVLGLFAYATGNEAVSAYAIGYLGYMILRLVMQLYTREDSALTNLAYSFMGQMYIALPLGLMSFLWAAMGGNGYLLLAMFVMIWLNDTGAYVVGSSIGRHKMFPRVSPKKSWEGFVGGLVFAVCGGLLLKVLLPEKFIMFEMWQMMAMGAYVGIFATWGDLIESLIKRTLGVKDSGNLIPGHGGILDRIDSLLLVVPSMMLFIYFVM